MNLPLRLLAVAVCALPSAVFGGAQPRDLGQGLSYYRVHELPGDLPSPPLGRPGPCVLDLRFAKADEIAASALRAWVRFNVSAHSPIFVLENAATSPSLLAALTGSGPAGLIVIAPESVGLGPDIRVRVAADADRAGIDDAGQRDDRHVAGAAQGIELIEQTVVALRAAELAGEVPMLSAGGGLRRRHGRA